LPVAYRARREPQRDGSLDPTAHHSGERAAIAKLRDARAPQASCRRRNGQRLSARKSAVSALTRKRVILDVLPTGS
jgi:hypothetical protein